MSSIKFYTNPMSRGQIARWALEEAGAHYEQILLDYGTGMKDASYLAINPMGKVPAVVHKGQVVTECAAICAYLADAFPEAGLAPTEAERGAYYRWLFFTAGPVEQAVTNNFLGVSPTAEQQKMAGYGSFDAAIDVLAGHVGTHDYVCGTRFTMADVYVGSQVLWGLDFKSMPAKPEFADYAARLRARPAYQRAMAIDSELIAAAQQGG